MSTATISRINKITKPAYAGWQSAEADFVHFVAATCSRPIATTLSHSNRNSKPACTGWQSAEADFAHFVAATCSRPLTKKLGMQGHAQ